ncbi:MAG: GIY-YIG nuclease family protein [Candidatus Desulfofervidaceae bacterium]|nr:GIY-YIG nuclease family protein [Candidatus Desulfofervidaceae bacterium]MDL1970955.1 GIY-YIG nuclease family protein [Candidatus Desulfofervidaceae bacterium]
MQIPTQKGVYALIIEISQKNFITVGKLGGFLFEPGFYAYIGSAQRGLRIRFKRHLNKEKKKQWHIDYLLDKAFPYAGIFSITADRIECQVAQRLATRLPFTPGFGVSDCNCESHLFYHPQKDILQKEVINAFCPYLCSVILFSK